jgi:glyoxylate utilization-related uncharacterized protein
MDDAELIALLERADLPARFERWELTLPAGAHRSSTAPEWVGTLVLVAQGCVEVDCGGDRRSFGVGDVLVPGALPPHTLRNSSDSPARLVAVRRRRRRPTTAILALLRSPRRSPVQRRS